MADYLVGSVDCAIEVFLDDVAVNDEQHGDSLASTNDFHSLSFAYSFHLIVSNREGVRLGVGKKRKARN
jgi:hypothetical protein